MRTNKELLIEALQQLVNEIIPAVVEKDGTRWSRISPQAFHRAQSALLTVRKPRSPYQARREARQSLGEDGNERSAEPPTER